jgi:hypothetical protein
VGHTYLQVVGAARRSYFAEAEEALRSSSAAAVEALRKGFVAGECHRMADRRLLMEEGLHYRVMIHSEGSHYKAQVCHKVDRLQRCMGD